MTRRLLVILGLVLAVPAALLAADALEEYGLDAIQVQNSVLGAFRGWYDAPDVQALKALPPEQRAAAVNTLGTWLKTYVASTEFKADYLKAWKSSKPKTGGLLGSLSKKALLDKAVDKAMGNKPATDPNALDKDPNVTLRTRLKAFLDATADVDYEARTTGSASSRRFADADLEAKPPEWKMCFRAGREAGEAARAFAQQWLEELGPARP